MQTLAYRIAIYRLDELCLVLAFAPSLATAVTSCLLCSLADATGPTRSISNRVSWTDFRFRRIDRLIEKSIDTARSKSRSHVLD